MWKKLWSEYGHGELSGQRRQRMTSICGHGDRYLSGDMRNEVLTVKVRESFGGEQR